MQLFKKQRGIGAIRFIITLLFFLVVIYLAWLIVPIYYDNYSVRTSISSFSQKDLMHNGVLEEPTAENIRNYVAKALRINNVSSVPLEAIQVTKVDSEFQVTLNYAIRKNVVGNLDIIVTFFNTAKVSP